MSGPCFHEWRLAEAGYTRVWSTEFRPARIIARSAGLDDFSENGFGVYLVCVNCGARKPVPDDYEIDYR